MGAVASISANPSARRVSTVGAMIGKEMGKAYFLAFLEPEDFLDSFLVEEEEDEGESEEEPELLSDDLEESEDFEESEDPESPSLEPSFFSLPVLVL